jgi:sortase A
MGIYLLYVLIGWMVGVAGVLSISKNSASTVIPVDIVKSTQTPISQKSFQPATPYRLLIPSIGVSSKIEPVGKDSENRMDIPENIYDAGWYKYGVRPGEKGNVVIDGHVNTPNLTPNIFYNLDKLQSGDVIKVIDDNGNVWIYNVSLVTYADTQNFPIDQIFGPSDKYILSLITCAGEYQTGVHDYSKRIIVQSELSGQSR